jgi:hypothetical protein
MYEAYGFYELELRVQGYGIRVCVSCRDRACGFKIKVHGSGVRV